MRKLIVYMLVLTLTACCAYIFPVSGSSRQPGTDNLIRFHVVANSDSPEDQALKLRVKDRIISEIGTQASCIEDTEQMLGYLSANMEHIEGIARQEIQDGHREYEVRAEVGKFPFPTKSYGSLALPAGQYHALRIIIGEGRGANWWCVMFPPLCFVDAKNGVVLAKDQDRVKEMLAGGEYENQIVLDDIEKVPVRARFKVLEFINESRIKLAESFR